MEDDPDFDVAKYVVQGGMTSSCKKLGEQTGCRIYHGHGSCTAYDSDSESSKKLFTATSRKLKDGSIEWEVDGEFKADAVLVKSWHHKKSCSYLYSDDAMAGQGLGYRKSNRSFAHVAYVDVCTDGKNNSQPDIPIGSLPECPSDVQSALDESKLGDTDFAIAYNFDEELGVVSTVCVKGGLTQPDFDIIPCVNRPIVDQVDSDLPFCSEVVSPETGLPFEFQNINSYDVIGVRGSACVVFCPNANVSLGGRSQCVIMCG